MASTISTAGMSRYSQKLAEIKPSGRADPSCNCSTGDSLAPNLIAAILAQTTRTAQPALAHRIPLAGSIRACKPCTTVQFSDSPRKRKNPFANTSGISPIALIRALVVRQAKAEPTKLVGSAFRWPNSAFDGSRLAISPESC